METGEVVDLKEASQMTEEEKIEHGLVSSRKSVRLTTLIKDTICEKIMSGMTLSAICRDPSMPSLGAVYANRTWDSAFDKAVRDAYKYRAEAYHDLAIDTAVGSIGSHKDAIPSIKLAVDTLKWAAEKNDPGRYATKDVQQANHGIQIIIDTGVSNSTITDININEQGEFIGFGGSDAQDTLRGSGGVDSTSEPIELSKDRWKEVGGGEE